MLHMVRRRQTFGPCHRWFPNLHPYLYTSIKVFVEEILSSVGSAIMFTRALSIHRPQLEILPPCEGPRAFATVDDNGNLEGTTHRDAHMATETTFIFFKDRDLYIGTRSSLPDSADVHPMGSIGVLDVWKTGTREDLCPSEYGLDFRITKTERN